MESRWRNLIIGCLMANLCGLAPVSGGPARAEIELGTAGDIGVHGLTDTRESPGATCRFAQPLTWSLGGTWIQVRPPVMFARDTTDRNDQQLVGWRAEVMAFDPASGAWAPMTEGETQRAVAQQNRAAQFDSRGPETEFFVGYGAYLVTTELFWYERMGPGEEPLLAGRAEYQVANYAIAVRERSGTRPIGVSTVCQLGR